MIDLTRVDPGFWRKNASCRPPQAEKFPLSDDKQADNVTGKLENWHRFEPGMYARVSVCVRACVRVFCVLRNAESRSAGFLGFRMLIYFYEGPPYKTPLFIILCGGNGLTRAVFRIRECYVKFQYIIYVLQPVMRIRFGLFVYS